MRSHRRARINGFSFVEWPLDHHNTWHVLDQDGIKGVWEGVDVRREDTARPLAHGSFDTQGFLASRVIPISGHISTGSPTELVHEMNRLTGLLSDGQNGRLTLEDDASTTWIDVRLGGATQVTQLDSTTAKFLVTFFAADPRRFGEPAKNGGFTVGEAVYHYGNHPAVLVPTVSGPVTAPYTVAVGSKQFTVTQSLTAGQKHVLDTETATVTRNGVAQSGVVSRAETLLVPPGSPVSFTGPAGTTGMVLNTFV